MPVADITYRFEISSMNGIQQVRAIDFKREHINYKRKLYVVELRGPILSAQAGHQLSIYYIKELCGRNSPHLASVNSACKIYEIVVRC